MSEENAKRYRESNTYTKKKEEEKIVNKVTSGTVIKKKQSVGRKFADTFVSEDVGSVKSYILFDVLIPALKDTFSSMVSTGVDMLLFGELRGKKRSGESRRGGQYTNYSRYSSDEKRPTKSYRDSYNYDDIVLGTRGEAEEVLDCLVSFVEDYGMASVADLYNLVGEKGEYTDNKYGWYDLKTATVSRVSDGYLIKLPRTTILD